MTYTPINWQTGDTITAEKLNRCDNGWEVSSTQLFSETVTTESTEYGNEGSLAYAETVTAAEITVIFNNVEYTCPRVVIGSDGYGYGGVTDSWTYDYHSYPFALVFTNSDGNILATETAGTYTIDVSISTVEASSQFSSAVNSVIPKLIPPFDLVVNETTIGEFQAALSAKQFCYIVNNTSQYIVTGIGMPSSGTTPLNVLPVPGGGSFSFDSNGILRFV